MKISFILTTGWCIYFYYTHKLFFRENNTLPHIRTVRYYVTNVENVFPLREHPLFCLKKQRQLFFFSASVCNTGEMFQHIITHQFHSGFSELSIFLRCNFHYGGAGIRKSEVIAGTSTNKKTTLITTFVSIR